MKLRQIEEQGSNRVGRIANKKEAVTLSSTADDLGLILQKNSGLCKTQATGLFHMLESHWLRVVVNFMAPLAYPTGGQNRLFQF